MTQYAVVLLCVAGSIVHLFAFNEKTAHDGPTLFTTAGIFFTFVGIAEGLYGLDVNNIESLTANSRAFTEAGSSLATLLVSLNDQRAQIQGSIESLGQLLSTASTAIPQIERNVIQLTEQMTFGVHQHQQAITTAITEGTGVMHSASVEMKSAMNSLQAHNQETNTHIRQLSDRMSEQIAKIDLALEKELSKSISTLGSQLTALSKQFVDDYAPLIDRLREFTKATRATTFRPRC